MRQLTLGEIADRVGGTVASDDAALMISGVRPLDEARAGDIAVLVNRSELRRLAGTQASAAIVGEGTGPLSKPAIHVANPRFALARLLELFYMRPRQVTGVDPRAVIAPGVRLGRDANIAAGAYLARGVDIGDRVDVHPGVYLGEDVRVGDDTVLFANVSIYPGTLIGKRVRIHSGAVIGSDGFGYTRGPAGEQCKIPQVGGVEIEDDVEIGANSTIDRATMTVTRIGRGTKIDNLVQIAHNVRVGADVCIVAQSGVAGSVQIGNRAVLAAAAGLIDHITVGEGAVVAARAGVTKDVPAGLSVGGTPAIPLHEAVRAYTLIERLPEYRRRLKELEERCARLEAALSSRKAD